MENKKIIPICFALDEGYIMPTVVAAHSLLKHLSLNSVVHIFVLVPEAFNMEMADKLLALEKEMGVLKVELIKITDKRFNDKCTISHITYPTYYRLVMDKFIKYDKVLYLDGDILVLGDITEIYNLEIGNNYIAGAVHPYSQLRKRDKKEAMKRLGIDSYSKYVNAGVLLFNLKAIRDDNMGEKFLSLIDKNFPIQDQDILNSACYPKIKIISPKYNAVKEFWTYSKLELCNIFDAEQIIEVRKNPIIFHFADKFKPWKYLNGMFEKEWSVEYCKTYRKKIKKRKHFNNIVRSKIIDSYYYFKLLLSEKINANESER